MSMTHCALNVPMFRVEKLHHWYLEEFKESGWCPLDWGCIDAPELILCGSRKSMSYDSEDNAFVVSSFHWR